MESPTNIVRLRQPADIDDPLTEVLRAGARRLLAQAVELEAETFLSAMQDLRLPDGRARLVRHGHGPEREIQTGIGPVPVARVRARDRGAAGAEDRVRFSSTILPKWARRSRSLDALLPVVYLRGVSTGDFQEALSALLGKDAPNLSPRGRHPADCDLGGRVHALAGSRPLSTPLRLRLGRRNLPAGPDGGSGRVHACADRRHTRGQKRTRRLPGGGCARAYRAGASCSSM